MRQMHDNEYGKIETNKRVKLFRSSKRSDSEREISWSGIKNEIRKYLYLASKNPFLPLIETE